MGREVKEGREIYICIHQKKKNRTDFIASCAQTLELVVGASEDWTGLEKHENCLKLKSYSRFRLYL